MKKNLNGFTIVELLIVIVVIAILASISVVGYRSIQSRAHDAAIRSDFRNIRNKMELYRSEYNTYPHDPNGAPGNASTCNQASGDVIKPLLETIEMRLSTGSYNTSTANTNLLYLASNNGEHYALFGYALGNPTYYISDQVQQATVYTGNSAEFKQYPGGSPCAIADNVGVSDPAITQDFGFYYIYTKNAGGFRIWN